MRIVLIAAAALGIADVYTPQHKRDVVGIHAGLAALGVTIQRRRGRR